MRSETKSMNSAGPSWPARFTGRRAGVARPLAVLPLLFMTFATALNGQYPTAYSDIGANGSFATIGYCVTGAANVSCGLSGTNYIAAPFTLPATQSLSNISLALAYVSGSNGVTVSLTNNSSGVPGTVIESWSVSNLPVTTPEPLTTVVSKLNPTLQAGQTYWVEVEPLAADTVVSGSDNNQGLNGGLDINNGSGFYSTPLLAFAVNQAPISQQLPGQSEFLNHPRSATAQPLLFAFATNQAGFDTEIVLSNTSQDTFGSTPTSGTCSLSFYGTGAPSPSTQTTTTIAAGKQLAFYLSKGGGGVGAAPGFQGYIIANCAFTLARGSARLFGNSLTASVFSASQEAQVLTLPRSTGTTQNLLFPLVTTGSGYDTGVAISNTTSDPFGANGATSRSGTCTLTLYGGVSPQTFVTPSISAGTTYTNVASALTGGAAFNGYVTAQCNFGTAAGYAFVSYGIDTTQSLVYSGPTPEVISTPRISSPQSLLFPLVVGTNGVPSGVGSAYIEIANTSTDPFVNGLSATPQSGTCILTFYGAGAPIRITTPTIPSGTVYSLSVYAVAPSFEGYVTGNCTFDQARGFAEFAALSGDSSFGIGADPTEEAAELVVLPRSTASSSLLFSHTTNWNFNDTIITISNTSQDSFGSATASGACTISYFGSVVGGANPPSPQTSLVIPPGGQLSFTLSSGNASLGIAGAPNFRGYIIANCAFPSARGVTTFLGAPSELAFGIAGGPDGTAGTAYSQSLAPAGGTPPYNVTIVSGSLPSGLNLNPTTGAISGTPTGPPGSTSSFTAAITDSGNPETVQQSFNIRIGPIVNSLNPQSAAAGGAAFNLTITGADFVAGSTVRWTGSAGQLSLTPSNISAAQIVVNIPASLLSSTGTASVAVVTNGYASIPVSFTITAAAATPQTVSLSPNSAFVGSSALTLTVNGANFSNGNIVLFNGSPISTTFVNPTRLTATVSAALLSVAGAATVSVNDSNTLPFYVQPPVITSLSPTSTPGGNPQFTLTVSGSGFNSSSTVYFNGTALVTTVVNSGQLTAIVPANQMGSNVPVKVLNLTASSNSLIFTLGQQPYSCSLNSGTAPMLRVGGEAELMGDLLLNCTPGTVNSGTVTQTVTVSPNNFNFTSRILNTGTNATEALLLVGDPAPAAQVLGTNVFQGTLQGSNMVFTGVRLNTAVSTTVRIVNLRANTLPFTLGTMQQQAASVTVSMASISVANSVQTLGFVKPTAFSSANVSSAGSQRSVQAQFMEEFANAFRIRVASGGVQNVPGTVYNTESGFVNPTLVTGAGLADTGTRLLLQVNGVPAGVSAYAAVYSDDGSAARMVSTDSNGVGPEGSYVSGSSLFGGTYAPISVSNGTGVAVWEVISASAPATLSFHIVLTGMTQTGLGPIVLKGTSAPLSSVTTATATDPLPRFSPNLLTSFIDMTLMTTSGTAGQVNSEIAGDPAGDPLVSDYRDKAAALSSRRPRPAATPASPPSITAGSVQTFSFNVLNSGSGPTTNVNVSSTVPALLTFGQCTAPMAPVGTCSVTANGDGSTSVTAVYPGPLSSGDEELFSFTATVCGLPACINASGTVNTTVDASGSGQQFADDGNPDDNFSNGSFVVVSSNTTPPPVTVSFATNPPGVVSIPAQIVSQSGSLSFSAPQTVPSGSQLLYSFNSWSDGSTSASRTGVPVPLGGGTFTANYDTQYPLTLVASPAAGGTVVPTTTPPGNGIFYTAGNSIELDATPAAGYAFSGYTGGAPAPSASTSLLLTMPSQPLSITANFTPLPVLAIASAHVGNFTQSQTNATYTLTVSNTGIGATSGTVMVTETLPAGLTLVSMNGGVTWACNGNTCTRNDALNPNASYPAITVTVSVASNAPAMVTNQVSVSLGGSAAANASDPTTIVALQTITFGSIANVVFGVSPFPLSATASSGLAVSFTSTTTPVCTVSGATVTIVATGTCSITASQPGNTNYAAAPSVMQSFIVNKQTQSVTFGTVNPVAFGVAPFTISATASSGLPVGFASTTTPVCTVSGATVTIVAAGSCSITATQPGNANYFPATMTQTFNVTPGTQTIAFGSLNNVGFPVAAFTISATASSGLTVTFASTTTPVCTVSGTTVTIVAMGICSIVANQSGNSNYSAATPVTQSFTVATTFQTITFGPLSNVLFGSAPFTLTATASSGLTVGFASTTPGVCTVSGVTVTIVGGGTCSITATQPGNVNIPAANPVVQSFTVVPETQTITFPSVTPPGTLTFPVSATASSGLPVTIASQTPTACTVSGTTVTVVSSGICTLQATQSGNANFAAATPAVNSFVVTYTGQTIAFAALANQVFGVAPFTVSATASSGLTVNLTSTTPGVCTVSGNTVTIAAAGTCSITATQPGSANVPAATPVVQSFTVSPAMQTIMFAALANQVLGVAPFTVSATASSGLPVSFASTTAGVCTVLAATVTVLAAGTCSITASQPGNTNFFAAANTIQSFTVTSTILPSQEPGEVGVFRGGNQWLLDANNDHVYIGPPQDKYYVNFLAAPAAGDIPVVGDWNGSGNTKIGIYRPSTGQWFLDYNGNGVFDAGDKTYSFGGIAGDKPVVGDWSGSGTSKIGIFRSGYFWLLDYNGDGTFDNGDQAFAFGGIAGDVPVVGDWTGDGKAKVGVVRVFFPGGTPAFWILDANNDHAIDTGDLIFAFGGITGDLPVTGDWNGTGFAKAGMYRGGFYWVVDNNGSAPVVLGSSQVVAFGYGFTGDIPVVGKW